MIVYTFMGEYCQLHGVFFMVKLVGLCRITCDSDRNWERIVSLGLLRMSWFNSIHSCVWSYLLCMQFTLSTSRETRQSNVWCCVCHPISWFTHISYDQFSVLSSLFFRCFPSPLEFQNERKSATSDRAMFGRARESLHDGWWAAAHCDIWNHTAYDRWDVGTNRMPRNCTPCWELIS